MRRSVKPATAKTVLTVQAGAFTAVQPSGSPTIEKLDIPADSKGVSFGGYEPAEAKDVDLTKAEVIVSAGRGVGKKDNIPVIAELARALGGELGASRPVVDSGWVEHSHQVGTTGQTVSPKLYVACGISGAIQHLAGMKKSDFVVAINKDRMRDRRGGRCAGGGRCDAVCTGADCSLTEVGGYGGPRTGFGAGLHR